MDAHTDPPGMPCGNYLILAGAVALVGVALIRRGTRTEPEGIPCGIIFGALVGVLAFLGLVRLARGVNLAVDGIR